MTWQPGFMSIGENAPDKRRLTVKVLEIVNIKREALARITWHQSGQIAVEAEDDAVKRAITKLLADVSHTGISLMAGSKVEKDGKTYFVQERLVIKPEDERFLAALKE